MSLNQGNSENVVLPIQPTVTVVNTGNISALAVFKQGDDFEVFEERLDQLFMANIIEGTRKVAVLLTLLSEEVYKILRDLCSPEKPNGKDFDTLIQLLRLHFKQRVSVYRRRIVFDSLRQGQESINDWYLRVKNAATQCDFMDKLMYRVQDKFVTGMRPGHILDRLCEESPSKSFQELLEIALNKEAALREQTRNNAEVNKLQEVRQKASSTSSSNISRNGEKIVERHSDKERHSDPEDLRCNFCNKTKHNFSKCKYRTFICKKCGKKGHIMAACKLEQNHLVEEEENENILSLYNLTDIQQVNFIKPLYIPVVVDDKVSTQMELDTGAGISCMPHKFYLDNLSYIPLNKTGIKLKTYSGEIVNPEGKITVKISIQNVSKICNFTIVKKATKMLLGRDIISKFNMSLKNSKITINDLAIQNKNNELDKILSKYSKLFQRELGRYNGEKVTLEIDENVKPVFHKPHPLPFAFREKVEVELKRLESEGAIERADNSLWGTPLVPVMKPNGKDIRVCANYKITVNKYLKDFNHPLPRIEDIFAALQGGQKYSKLDFLNAYNQLVLDDTTSELLSWSTPLGIYRIKRLPYGTKPACSIFQNVIEKVLQGCRSTVNFLDDVVVTGKDDREHLENLEEVLKRLERAGFRLNEKKCEFFKENIYS
ncbi:uncharacterized protein [Diabrotica undecimpunctata]|uniref:uncharacterized protein n=1 Tax=Diabrotica undecimpunctata TaxID=50387 RepID=UPI003B635A0B